MRIHTNQTFKKSVLCLALSSAFTANGYVLAEEAESKADGIERIEVTGSRRASTVQEAPMNITALDGDVMKDQNITQLSDVARWVPGLTVQDQGGRDNSPIIVRGLNTNSSGPDSDGGTVATYVGEIPLLVDMKVIDVERVEVLIGPQGTLYGAGTLGGAIRYLPNKPILDETSGSIYGDVFNIAHSDDTGGEAGFVFNTPLIDDTLGLRVAFNYLDEPGYIDYAYTVKEGGVSLPDPDWSDSAAVEQNIKRVNDVNSEQATTARIMLRWQPNDIIDSTLSYFYQKQEIGGRSIVHANSLSNTNQLSTIIGDYDSAYRYLEPAENEDSLVSLEITADLGFAELTSATGFSKSETSGQRDQTDLLIRLDYGYEEFPAFSAFTRDADETDTITQEIRLVSTGDSALSWIVGGFYNKYEESSFSKEFTLNYSEYALKNGVPWYVDEDTGERLPLLGEARPDSLEYIQVNSTEIIETALFGELSYQATEQLSLTLGARFYQYDVKSKSAFDLPLSSTILGDYTTDEINLDLEETSADDDGDLFKFNVSYQFNDDILAYATVSEGFRIGGSNGVPACTAEDIETNQPLCGLPHEVVFTADTTTNYELGFKSTWFSNKFHFNAALFLVEWNDAQITGATANGQLGIISNAASAESKGIEISSRAMLSDSLTAYATYAYTQVELTEDAPHLFGVPSSEEYFLEDNPEALHKDYHNNKFDAYAGDRLPGSPEQQVSLGLTYSTEVFDDKLLDVNYGLTYQSDMYSKVGLRDFGEEIPGYALSNISARVSGDEWSVTLYVDNMFDKYAYTSVRHNVGIITDGVTNGVDIQRNYGHYLLTPRKIGLRFDYMFDM
ncbi:TonB-dependent receptor [Candidatus Colwellia aromaticivorans]|uniref:TonB-dependent receptor n=1 Tax=Candidatus Colwellia aromaticivorans TaxID=2267621 RepID=UPI000DF322B7|nr:TonB-dependent receptor [Candidatus Colwellia aromaticivorans]